MEATQPINQLMRNLAIICIFLCLGMTKSFAQTQHVFDFAKVYDAELLNQYDTLLSKIEAENNLRVEAVIMQNFQSRVKEEVINHFITELSNRQPEVDFSALLFVSLDEEYASIHTSNNILDFYPPQIQDEIIGKVKNQIKDKNYKDILKFGVGGIVHYFNQNVSTKESSAPTWLDFLKNNFVFIVMLIALVFMFGFKKKKPPKQV